jgi:hypothetical protein
MQGGQERGRALRPPAAAAAAALGLGGAAVAPARQALGPGAERLGQRLLLPVVLPKLLLPACGD